MRTKHLVIGNSVESLLYALMNGHYHLSNSNFPPLFYETVDFSVMGTKNKKELWTKLRLFLSFSGKNIVHENIEKIKLNEGLCTVLGEEKKVYEFEKAFVFDTAKVIPQSNIKVAQKEKKYRVIDDLKIKNLGKDVVNLPQVGSGGTLASKITFYTSDRIDGAKYITDCVVESTLTRSQTMDINYSDTVVKFCVQRALHNLNQRGRITGLAKNGKTKHYKPEATHCKRIMLEIDETKYEDTETIFFVDKDLREIADELAPEG